MTLGDLVAEGRVKVGEKIGDAVEKLEARAGDPAWVDSGVSRLREIAESDRGHVSYRLAAEGLANVLEQNRGTAASLGRSTLVDLADALDVGDDDAVLDALRNRATLAERNAARDAASDEVRAAVASDASAKRLALEILVTAGRFALGLLLKL